MNISENTGGKGKERPIHSPLPVLKNIMRRRHNPLKDLEELKKEVDKTKTSSPQNDYVSEGTIVYQFCSLLGKPFFRAEDLFGEDYGRLDEEKRNAKLLRARALSDMLKDLEKQFDSEKTSSAFKVLFSSPLFPILLSGSYISKDNKASLIPASFAAKVLECVICAQNIGGRLAEHFILLSQRAVLENTLINRATNLDKLKNYAFELSKIKSENVAGSLLEFSAKHNEVFVDEAKTNSFMSAVNLISGCDILNEDSLCSFIADENTGLWNLISENRVSDFSRNPCGYLMYHSPENKILPEIFSHTKEQAASLCCDCAQKEDVEGALKHFYVWKIKALGDRGYNTSFLASCDRLNEFTTIMEGIPCVTEYLKGFRIVLLEDSLANQKLGIYFDVYAMVCQNAGPYYPLSDSKKLAQDLVNHVALSQQTIIPYVKAPQGIVSLKEAVEKNLVAGENFKVIEFETKPVCSVREATYYRHKPDKLLADEVSGFFSVKWASEPSYWTIEVRKAFKDACMEAQKKNIGLIIASTGGICDGSFKQGDKITAEAYVKGCEAELSRAQIEKLIRSAAGCRGICLSKFELGIKYLEKTAESFYYTILPDHSNIFITWPGRQESIAKKNADKSEDFLIWFNGKAVHRTEYVGNQISAIVNCLVNVLELTVDEAEKIIHNHTALIEVEGLLIENSGLFRETLAETYRSTAKEEGLKTAYARAVSSLSGVNVEIIFKMVEESSSMDCGIAPDHAENPWNKYLSMLGENNNA